MQTVWLGAVLLVSMMLAACSQKLAEEDEKFGFRKGLQHSLLENCAGNNECIDVVQRQFETCLEKSDWKRFFHRQEEQKELQRFSDAMRGCLVDSKGEPFFQKP